MIKRSQCLPLLIFINSRAAGTESFPPAVTPQQPAILRNVSLVQSGQYMYPYVPSFRTSADGRVALSVKQLGVSSLQFYLLSPEKIDAQGVPFALSANPLHAPGILASAIPVTIPEANFGPAAINGYPTVQQHHTICDGTVQFPAPGAHTNPYACGASGASDCYNLTVIAPVRYVDSSGTKWVTLYGTPITVEVNNPKTQSASIESITTGTPVAGTATPFSFLNFFEPMVTADGHLLVGRLDRSHMTWLDNVTNTKISGFYEIVYSAGGPSSNPCDVTQWQNFYPIAHAPHDPNMVGRYGIADYPFRDSENNLIPETSDIEGTYPWVDRMGRNVFFMSLSSTLLVANGTGGVVARYPEACTPNATCTDPTSPSELSTFEDPSETRGVNVVGRWTHGKEVLLDALINNIDYGLQTPEEKQRMVTLYQSPTGAPVAVQLGSGRSNVAFTNQPLGYAQNTTILDSFENIFADLPSFKATTMRDVVWRMNMGKGGDEIAFDDYINPDSFIVAEMSASTTFLPYSFSNRPPYMRYNDGFVTPTTSNPGGFVGTIHLQNSATAVSSRWAIPPYGLVVGTQARTEPAALGGIKGKGFWLQGNVRVDYAVPAQPHSVSNASWLVNLFLDSRFGDDAVVRRILTFPDGSAVNLVGLHEVDFVQNGVKISGFKLPIHLTAAGWSNLAFNVHPGGKSIGLFLNGYRFAAYNGTQSLMQPVPGTISLGADPTGATAGFVGWVDEFKIIAQAVDLETICNHARGTLIGLNVSSDPSWRAIANSYPSAAHQMVSAQLTAHGMATFPAYACFVNYASDNAAPYLPVAGVIAGNLPQGSVSIRNSIHFPEGPLTWNLPRPNSSQNGFCLSCHVAGGQISTALSPRALQFNASILLQNDPRRQPLQPQRLLFGNVPAGFIDSIFPVSSEQAPASGILLDQWDFPSP